MTPRLLILYFLASTFSASAKVSIQVNNEFYSFANNPRLVEVLAKVTENQQWYWPASALYRLESLLVEKQRREIINRLAYIQLSLSQEDATKVNGLIGQINQWNLAERVNIKIDYDAAQMNANNNPRFENGSYRLDLITRPKSASVFGLISATFSIDLSNKQCAHQHIRALSEDLINHDYAYLIQPDGTTKKIGIAYWNTECVDVMPGSQIYLPLPESQFFQDNSLLNEQIVMLAKNRIVQ
ncbi:capsule biosynthesis GfcC family protein [Paraglaciecola hydrolytica]|uniref:capsule biosynthesis GfcC family protein n=1 Tax=Paraglaciecola hydrolytica TaxID=1799789 RepID=UPI000AA7C37B|nr:capsule biosynthesis GfcC family protein [Paraglaciecola hydrolytica]